MVSHVTEAAPNAIHQNLKNFDSVQNAVKRDFETLAAHSKKDWIDHSRSCSNARNAIAGTPHATLHQPA
jgi:hypothetical protein